MSNICRNLGKSRKKKREDNKEDTQRQQRLRMTKSHIITPEHNKLTLWSRVLKEAVILASERISEIGIQAIERILPKVLHLIP